MEARHNKSKQRQAIFDVLCASKERPAAEMIYTALKRLEDAGCISSYWGDQSTGARRKYYTITELGKQTYKQKIDEWLEAKRLLDTLLHTEG